MANSWSSILICNGDVQMEFNKRITLKDIEWILLQFGCCIGIAIVYVPIQVAIAGIGPLVLATVVIFPVMYISLKNVSMIVVEEEENIDITYIFKKRLGKFFGFLATIMYFLTSYTVVIGYAIILPTSAGHALTTFNITQIDYSNSSLFIFLVLLVPFLIMMTKKDLMLKIVAIIVYPLIVAMLIVGFYLIPEWRLSNLYEPVSIAEWIKGFLLAFPMLVFGMNYCQSISQMVLYYKKTDMSLDEMKFRVKRNIFMATLIIVIFVMFFVFSCDFSLTLKNAIKGLDSNTSALSLIAFSNHLPFLKYTGPIIVLTGLLSSFIGCFLGGIEAISGIVSQAVQAVFSKMKINHSILDFISAVFILASLFLVAIGGFKMLLVTGILITPCIAAFIFLIPFIFKIILKKRNRNCNGITFAKIMFIIGVFALFSYYVGMLIH
ncbi:MAG: hypothetical protein GY756_17660 [bacterium]|nr:hypothetical protein [bacterium]